MITQELKMMTLSNSKSNSTPKPKPLNTNTNTNTASTFECCMCGDHGLSHQLFRCSVCHFRSQHRYCSNLYPKAESYRVCNWCLIQKPNDDTPTTTTITNSTSPDQTHTKPSSKKPIYNPHHHQLATGLSRGSGGVSPRCLQPTSPIKKQPIRSPEARSPSGRKRFPPTSGDGTNQAQAQPQPQKGEKLIILRRSKSSEGISANNNKTASTSNNNNNVNGRNNHNGGSGGPQAPIIRHVYRNKVRRYKLLDEVSC